MLASPFIDAIIYDHYRMIVIQFHPLDNQDQGEVDV
jgi:hypothetical protein